MEGKSVISKNILVLGAGGFIGSHLVSRLVSEGHHVTGADLKSPEFGPTQANRFVIADLREPREVRAIFKESYDEVYQLAADMGGAGYVFTGDNDADIMHNSALINLNVLEAAVSSNAGRVFYSSSACMYPEYNQVDPSTPVTREDSAYPAAPDSEYGWEKLFSERLYGAFARNYGLTVRVARYHNIYGPEGTWQGGREKAPAALCRKVAQASDGGTIEIWGDGLQTRSFLYVDDCVEATIQLMRNDNFAGPVNIGSEEMVTINQLANIVMNVSEKHVTLDHVSGPLGVRGRNSHNELIRQKLGWEPKISLVEGMRRTFDWINQQVLKSE